MSNDIKEANPVRCFPDFFGHGFAIFQILTEDTTDINDWDLIGVDGVIGLHGQVESIAQGKGERALLATPCRCCGRRSHDYREDFEM